MKSAGRTGWRRLRWPAVVVGVLLTLYVGGYAALYRRGVAEADAFGSTYFFYDSFLDVLAARDSTRQHHVLLLLYGPLNALHHDWLGGRSACRCMMFGLSRDWSEE